AESRETPFDSTDHIYELKWDGTRAICFRRDKQRFQNRRMTFIEPRYPDLKVRKKKPAIHDGEIVVMWDGRPSFEKLQERERPGGKIHQDYLVKTLPATYVAFDVLYIGTESVMGQNQMERKALLREVIEEDDRVVLSDYIEARGVDYYNAVIARGLEGIIAKRKDARYVPGKRSKDWIKIKKKTTLDCVIAGITAGEGEREDTFGSLILGAYHEGSLFHVGRVGTGFSEAFRRSLPAARGPTPGRMSVPRGAGDRRSRGLLDPARPRGRGAFPRVLQGTPYARPLILADARGQAPRRLHRDVLGGLFAIGRNPVLTRQ